MACEDCLEYCQFEALSLQEVAQVDALRCVGCGVCVPACPEGALGLVRRPEVEVEAPPLGEMEWYAAARRCPRHRPEPGFIIVPIWRRLRTVLCPERAFLSL